MSSSDRLFDYLDAWETAFRAGDDRPPEAVAPDAPDLWDDLRHRFARRRRMLQFLEIDVPVGQTVDQATTPGDGTGAADEQRRAELAEILGQLRPPQAPGELGRLGDYRLLRLIGQGGMGAVFAAEDTRLRRAVALKVMLPAVAAKPLARKRFVREARAAAAVEHDNVLTIHYVGDDGPVPYIATQLLAGEGLDARLARGRVPFAEALRIAGEIAAGLAAAHARGLVHRDIKPGNIFLEAGTGRVKVLDFGLARTEDDGDRLTHEGAVVGTPAYMAPEQANGGAVDARADVFSLGCVVYEMLTGRRPFRGANTFAILTALATTRPPAPREVDPNIPAELSAFAMRLLERDPAARPQTAADVRKQINALTRTGPGAAPILVQPLPDENPWGAISVEEPEPKTRGGGVAAVTQLAEPSRRRPSRLPIFLTLAGVAAAIVMAVGVVWKLKDKPQEGPGPDAAKPGKPDDPAAEPTAWDLLDREQIPLAERVPGQPRDVVGVFNSHRQRDWQSMTGIAAHPNGKYVVTGSQQGPYLRLWHPESLDLLDTVVNPGGNQHVVFSRDGKRMASTYGQDAGITLWDAGGKKPAVAARWPLPNDGRCGQLVFTPDGDRLIAAGRQPGSPVYVWDLNAAPPEGVPLPDSAPTAEWWTQGLALSPDGTRLVTPRGVGAEGMMLWDMAAAPPRKLATFGAHTKQVGSLAYTRDGTKLYSGGEGQDCVVMAWDMTKTPPARLAVIGADAAGTGPFSYGVRGVRETPDGRHLVVADVRNVILFDIVGGRYVRRSAVSYTQGPLYGFDFGPDGRAVYSCASEGNAVGSATIVEGELQPGPTPSQNRLFLTDFHDTLAVRPDRAEIAFSNGSDLVTAEPMPGGDWKEVIRLRNEHILTGVGWDAAAGTWEVTGRRNTPGGTRGAWLRPGGEAGQEVPLDVPTAAYTVVRRSADGRTAAVATWEGDVAVMAAAGPAVTRKFSLPRQEKRVNSHAVSADGRLLATTCPLGPVRVWDISGAAPKLLHELLTTYYAWVAFSPDGRVLAVADNAKGFHVIDLVKAPRPEVTFLSAQPCNNLAFHPSKPWVAAAHYGVTVWNYATGRAERTWSFPGPVNAVAFTPDGRHLVTGNQNCTAYVLRLETLPKAKPAP